MLNRNLSSPILYTLWLLLWSALLVTFCISLPAFSDGDTYKYLSISKDMATHHNYLLSYWNGHLYSDKPPLLFWLILSGWKLLGVNTWWPQLLVLIFATISIFITQKLARAFWPLNKTIAQLTPFILIGCIQWVWYAKEVRVDEILMLATLLSLYFLIKSLHGERKYWLGYIISLGLGGFAKGPVILVFTLLPAIFLPAVLTSKENFSPKWYAYLALTSILGLCIPLLWAIPAAIYGGKSFTHQIFYTQISHRMYQHKVSYFFYLLNLPLWLIPWSIYPPVWKNIKSIKTSKSALACLIIIIAGLVVFTLFGQKLPHYLYPIFPIFGILIAYLISQPSKLHLWHQWPTALVTLLFGVFCLSFTYFMKFLPHDFFIRTYTLYETNPLWSSIIIATALLLFFFKPKTQLQQIILLTLTSVIISLFVNNILLYKFQQHVGNKPVLGALQKLNSHDVAVINMQHIHDKIIIHFIIEHHIANISLNKLADWRKQHPNGWVLTTNFNPTPSAENIWYYQTRHSTLTLEKVNMFNYISYNKDLSSPQAG